MSLGPLRGPVYPPAAIPGTRTGLGYEIERSFVSFIARPAGIAVASHRGAPSLSLRLPPGDYGLRVSGVDCKRIGKRITLTGDMRTVDLGTTNFEPTIIARHYGKEPPAWKVSDARGVDPSVTLADFKGKWGLGRERGHESGPSVAGSRVALASFAPAP